ncbi:hypothetical protein T265_01044 [Opisthorchis viverrini]|uniref:G-protein coupled receptors family 1 profile domain-containing protein n=1 Tax=Opisthorchis viverrini TaxID=6198 RepID=A0A075A0R0_OPIVI|nr:hypothetical protein T265_01044 [Opisthorchis viverrini]KER32951.1 hypothetical protein T265_01044 [Opisthorchis viverrini]
MLVGTLGIANCIAGLIGNTLWFLYLVGSWFCATGQERQVDGSQGSNQGGVSWPRCPLRPSTRLFMISMFINNLIGLYTSNLRYSLFLLVTKDVCFIGGCMGCRIHLYISAITTDLSTWHVVCLCCERFFLALFPQSNYARDRERIRTTLLIIFAMYSGSMLAEMSYLFPQELVCHPTYRSMYLSVFRLCFAAIVPGLLILTTTIGVTVILFKRARQMDQSIKGWLASNKLPEGALALNLLLFISVVASSIRLVLLLVVLVNPMSCSRVTVNVDGLDGSSICSFAIVFYWTACCLCSLILMASSKRILDDTEKILLVISSYITRSRSVCTQTP